MREILFRGKTLATESEWVEGFYVHVPCGRFQCDEHMIQTIDEAGRMGQLYDVYDSTVCQYTELADKNGKRIFDGDILKESDIKIKDEDEEVQISGHVWQVTMTKGVWCVRNKHEWDFLSSNAHHCEVIGNIHDNPELLEGKA